MGLENGRIYAFVPIDGRGGVNSLVVVRGKNNSMTCVECLDDLEMGDLNKSTEGFRWANNGQGKHYGDIESSEVKTVGVPVDE